MMSLASAKTRRAPACCADEVDQRIWSLTLPNILNDISTPLLGLVDSVVVGHLPDPNGLAGIALGLAVLTPLLVCFNFLRMGTVGLAAQAYGAGDGPGVRAVAWRTVILGFFIGSTIALLQHPIALLLGRLADNANIVESARQYFLARVNGAPAALGNFAIQGWLVGVQQSKEALIANLVLNICNAVLCILLGVRMGLGIVGVGAATALANYLALIYGLWRLKCLMSDKTSVLSHASDRREPLLNSRELWRLLTLNSAIFLRTACITGMGSTFTVVSAKFGYAVMAANSLLMQMQMLFSLGSDGLASAAEALVGEAVGARDLQSLRKAALSISKGSLGVAIAYTLLYMVGGRALLCHLTWHQEVQTEAVRYLHWQWVSPIVSVWAYLLDGFFVGATLPGPMRDSVLLSTLLFLILLQLPLGNDGLWVAYLAHLVVRAVALGAYYPRIEKMCQEPPALLAGAA